MSEKRLIDKKLIEKIITYNYNEYGSEFGDALVYLKQENEWLHHIIEEVRKYVKELIELKEEDYLKSVRLIYIEKILEILDRSDK